MTQNTGYKLNGFPIEYIGIQIEDHYSSGGVFLSTKILEKVLIQYSQTGKVTYSNTELMELFECTDRGLQVALNRLEAVDHTGTPVYDIIKRTYTDETKRVRTGFDVNIETAIKWLSATASDVAHLNRGNAFKDFVMQSVIVIRKYAKKLANLIKRKKSAKNIEKYEALINDLNNKKVEHETYIRKILNKAKKAIRSAKTVYSDNDIQNKLFSTVMAWGFTNPPN